MIITFVQPQMIGVKKKNLYKIQPIVYAKLKAHTPSDIECRFFDNRMEDIDYDLPTDIVAISLNTFTAQDGYKIAQEYHQRGAYIVIGGVHAYLLPDEILEYADTVLIGEIELLWENFLNDYKKGIPQQKYESTTRYDMVNSKYDRIFILSTDSDYLLNLCNKQVQYLTISPAQSTSAWGLPLRNNT